MAMKNVKNIDFNYRLFLNIPSVNQISTYIELKYEDDYSMGNFLMKTIITRM